MEDVIKVIMVIIFFIGIGVGVGISNSYFTDTLILNGCGEYDRISSNFKYINNLDTLNKKDQQNEN